MLSHINFFAPYDRAHAGHENQLTRALLVVLRYSPHAHQAWLNAIAPAENHFRLPEARFTVQSRRLVRDNELLSRDEPIRGISVWIAPDEASFEKQVETSSREQVLDGVIAYGNELVVVVENKIAPQQSTDQAQLINVYGAPVVFSGKPVSITWKNILDIFSDIRSRDLTPYAERAVISDLLDLIEEYFPHLGPYSTLSRCGERYDRLLRRLDTVQELATSCLEGKGLGWRNLGGTKKIAMAWLGLEGDMREVSLQMYPADTLGQARAFYADRKSVADILALRSSGWLVAPNFHWGFMAPGYAWMTSPMQTDDYCEYWLNHIESTTDKRRDQWSDYWSSLIRDGVVSAQDKPIFDESFENTNRQRANARPGLRCEYKWSLKEAIDLDATGQFVQVVRQKLNEVLMALRAPTV